MKKRLAINLTYLGNKCPECNKGKMEVIEVKVPFPNVGNFFLKCNWCDYEYDE